MDFEAFVCFAKLFSCVFDKNEKCTLSVEELDIACETLKNLSDKRKDWTDEQKDIYKNLVEFAKEYTKNHKAN